MDVHIPCPCPGAPHPEGDTVTLADKLDLRAGTAMQNYIVMAAGREGDAPRDPIDTRVSIIEAYLLNGISSWTLVDEKGRRRPVTEAAIRASILDDFAVAGLLAEAGDDLYQAAVIVPLVVRAQRFSEPGPTSDSTSAPPTTPPRKRSKRSSTSTSPTADIETTSPSPNGASSLSQSLELVGG